MSPYGGEWWFVAFSLEDTQPYVSPDVLRNPRAGFPILLGHVARSHARIGRGGRVDEIQHQAYRAGKRVFLGNGVQLTLKRRIDWNQYAASKLGMIARGRRWWREEFILMSVVRLMREVRRGNDVEEILGGLRGRRVGVRR